MKTFCEASGAAVNLNKYCGFFYGDWNVTPGMYERVRWTRKPGKYLRVPLQHSINSKTHRCDFAAGIRQTPTKWVNSHRIIAVR